jgi:hypothetical protein
MMMATTAIPKFINDLLPDKEAQKLPQALDATLWLRTYAQRGHPDLAFPRVTPPHLAVFRETQSRRFGL